MSIHLCVAGRNHPRKGNEREEGRNSRSRKSSPSTILDMVAPHFQLGTSSKTKVESYIYICYDVEIEFEGEGKGAPEGERG